MDDQLQSKSQSNNMKDAAAKVHDVAEQARSVALERADLVRDQAESAKAKAAESVRKLGHAVRKIGEHMRIEEQLYISERAQGASQQLESAASYIEDTDLSTLIHDVEDVTRRNAAWVIGGTFLVGFAAGRILKVPRDSTSGLSDQRTTPQLSATNDPSRSAPASSEPERRPARASSRQAEVRR